MWQYFNNNPCGRSVGDCAVRAISVALDLDWEQAYSVLAGNGFQMCDMPNADSVSGATLRQHGFYRDSVPNDCSDCYTAEDFCGEHQEGNLSIRQAHRYKAKSEADLSRYAA